MEEFNVWEVATDTQSAMVEIAKRVEEIQRLYKEAVLIAKTFDTYVSAWLDIPEEAEGGHNQAVWAHWSASSAEC